MVNGSLDLAARATVLQAFLFDLATIDAAKKFAMQRQMNRARGARVIKRSVPTAIIPDTRPDLSFFSRC